MISLIVIATINIINKTIPIEWIVFSTFGDTGFPFIFSIIKNKIRPPSNAGNGIIFIIPTLTHK